MKTVLALVAMMAAVVGMASAANPPGCCGPRHLDQLTIGMAAVRQRPPASNLQGSVNMMMYFDFNAEVAAFFIGNFSENLELYVQGGDIKKSFVYLPKYNVCTNITYQANILAQTQLCVGTGTDHPNFATSINLGHAVETESWGSADNHQYINVNPNGCVLTAVNQYDMPTAGGTMLGVYYNISTSVANDRVFNPPTACMSASSSLDTIAATHGPRHLQEITGAIDRSMNSLQDIMDMHHSVHKVTQH